MAVRAQATNAIWSNPGAYMRLIRNSFVCSPVCLGPNGTREDDLCMPNPGFHRVTRYPKVSSRRSRKFIRTTTFLGHIRVCKIGRFR